MTASVEPVTNEEIAELRGWIKVTGPGWAGKNVWARATSDETDELSDGCPDYLHDPGTLGEWEALVREKGWPTRIVRRVGGDGWYCVIVTDISKRWNIVGDGQTPWEAAWRAALSAIRAGSE